MSDHTQVSERRFIPRKVAMGRLGIGRQKWHELATTKRLPLHRIGGRVFMRSDELEAILENPEVLNAPRRAG